MNVIGSCTVTLRSAIDHVTAFPTTTFPATESSSSSSSTGAKDEDKVYFHANPDIPFEVHVSIDKSGSLGSYEALLVCLEMDGENIGYSHKAGKSHSSNVVFKGLYKSMESGSFKIFPFKFSNTTLQSEDEIKSNTQTLAQVSNTKRGSFTVSIYEAYEDRTRPPTVFSPANKGLKGGEEAIDKDKKFWTQPSVTVGCDDTKGTIQAAYAPSYPWCRVNNQKPLICCTGYYHTPNVIKILQRISSEENQMVDAVEPESTWSHKSKINSSSYSKKRDSAPLIATTTTKKTRVSAVIDLT